MVVKAKLNHHNWQLSWVTTQRQVISHKANENGPLKSAHVCQQLWVPGAICLEVCTLHRWPPANKATLSRTEKGKRTRPSCWRVQKAPFASWWFAASLAPAFISQSPRKMQSSSRGWVTPTSYRTAVGVGTNKERLQHRGGPWARCWTRFWRRGVLRFF